MRYLVAVILLVISSLAYSDDTYIYHSVGGTPAQEDGISDIFIKEELIRITLHENSYLIDVTIKFENIGKECRVGVGFPLFSLADPLSNSIEKQFRDFRTYVNGVESEFTLTEVQKYQKNGLTSFYMKEVVFKEREVTETRIIYQSDYSQVGMFWAVPYLYGTGKSWGARPWDIYVEIVNSSSKWLIDFKVNHPISRMSNNQNKVSLFLKGIFPVNINEMMEIWFFDQSFDIEFDEMAFLRSHILSDLKLKLMTKEQLRLLRNAFFAVHGYRFKSADLRVYFQSIDWYRPRDDFSEDYLTSKEKINVQKIQEEEKQRIDSE